MSEFTGTKGNWLAAAKPSSIVGWPVVGEGGRLICSIAWQPKPEHVSAEDYDAFYRECAANARLIAAAPALLEALQRIATATPAITNSQTVEQFRSWTQAVAAEALSLACGEQADAG